MRAEHTSLTTISNRYAFLEHIRQTVMKSTSLSLMLVDVVRFSDVSSTLGTDTGDEILVLIANRLIKLFGATASIGRVSGDVFGVVMPGGHSDYQLRNFYDHLIEHFKAPISVNGHSFVADFNVGAVSNTSGDTDVNRFFTRAEAALKQAKANKYENFHVINLMEKPDTGRSLALKADLKRAFANDELELYFQPKVNLKDLTIVGAECLLRWNHPLDGVIYPGTLIEAAESYNMMNEMGYWVLTRAFQSALKFQSMGLNLKLSVNMSPTQLYDTNFVPTLRRLGRAYCVDMSRIELELTEDVALSNSIMVKQQMAAIKQLGLTVAVDDFGKGYSNLAYIRELEVDTIKVDKTFVMELDKSPVNKAIIQAIQVIAEPLHCNVVAEGIETVEHLHQLREIGVDVGQGFLFSKAVPLNDFITLAQTELSIGDSLAFRSRIAG